jgi:hypothetical protein
MGRPVKEVWCKCCKTWLLRQTWAGHAKKMVRLSSTSPVGFFFFPLSSFDAGISRASVLNPMNTTFSWLCPVMSKRCHASAVRLAFDVKEEEENIVLNS